MTNLKKDEKLSNKRANLRKAVPKNPTENCKNCVFFKSPTTCQVVVGPVGAALVCDWIQSRGLVKEPQYTVKDEDWEAFGRGMVAEQPYQHIVQDAVITPAGPLVMIEDTAKPKHRFSLTKEFHISHTTLEHHWTQEEVDKLIARGKRTKEMSDTTVENALWTRKFINNLPDASFAVIIPGGEKDDSGRIVPRSLRKLPHHKPGVKKGSDHDSVDLPHLRNALARVSQTDLTPEQRKSAMNHLMKHAKALGVGSKSKEVKKMAKENEDKENGKEEQPVEQKPKSLDERWVEYCRKNMGTRADG